MFFNSLSCLFQKKKKMIRSIRPVNVGYCNIGFLIRPICIGVRQICGLNIFSNRDFVAEFRKLVCSSVLHCRVNNMLGQMIIDFAMGWAH